MISLLADLKNRAFNKRLILISPLALLATNFATAHIAAHFLGAWAWEPLMLEYWIVMTATILYAGGWPAIRDGYRRATRWGWWIPCLLLGILPLPILLLNHRLMRGPLLIACWLGVAMINPFFEESYWRGLLGEATRGWHWLPALLYPTLIFAASHPLGLGVFSIGCRNNQMLISLVLMGGLWSLVYRRTRSLQAITFSHILVDLCNMSVWVFLNLLIPK